MLDPPSSYWNCQPSSFASCFIILFSFVSMCKSLGWYYTGQRCWLAKVVYCLCRDCGIKHSVSWLTTVYGEKFSGLQVMENIGWDILEWDTPYVGRVCMYVSACVSVSYMYVCSDLYSVLHVCIFMLMWMWVFGRYGCGYMYILMFRYVCAFVCASQKMIFPNQHLFFESGSNGTLDWLTSVFQRSSCL